MTQETCPHGARVEYCCWDGKQVMMCIIWGWQWWTDFSCHCFLSSEAGMLGVPGTWIQYYLGNCVVRFILRPESQYNYKCYRFQQSTDDKHLPFKTLSIDCQPSVRQKVKMKTLPIIFVIGFLCLFNVTNSRSLNTQVTQFQIPLAEYVQDTINYCKWCYRTHTQLTKSIK